jgi:hypothetical protein
MGNLQQKAHQKFCWVCWWTGRCWRFAASGSFKQASTWATILGAGLLGVIANWWGRSVTFDTDWQGLVASGLVYTAVAWVAVFLTRLIAAPFFLYRDGEWHGQRYVYREPQLAAHLFAQPAHNNKVHNFRFPDAPPFSLIYYGIEFDGRASFSPYA